MEASSSLDIAVLLTCHNRREKTVACLKAVRRALDYAQPGVRLRCFLTDDGSTDGTSAAVKELGLDIEVIRGDGSLYWNRGMVRAWEAATRWGSGFDAYLLLNDDTLLDSDALTRIVNVSTGCGHQAIVVGATREPTTGELTYGGAIVVSNWHPGRTQLAPISEREQEVDTFNANCVLVPRYVYERLGTLDPTFHHSIGDFDYGLRARKAGIRIIVVPRTIGTCARNDSRGTWRDRSLPLRRRLALLNSPKGLPRREWTEYLRRHGARLAWVMGWAPAARVVVESVARRWRLVVRRDSRRD